MMPMMNNPMMQALNMVRSGRNPMGLIQQMAAHNPRMAPAMKMIQGKNANQLRSIAENMARERGTDLNAVAQQLGITLPGTTK